MDEKGRRGEEREAAKQSLDRKEVETVKVRHRHRKWELHSSVGVFFAASGAIAALMRPFLPVACDSVSSPPSLAAPHPPDTHL